MQQQARPPPLPPSTLPQLPLPSHMVSPQVRAVAVAPAQRAGVHQAAQNPAADQAALDGDGALRAGRA